MLSGRFKLCMMSYPLLWDSVWAHSQVLLMACSPTLAWGKGDVCISTAAGCVIMEKYVELPLPQRFSVFLLKWNVQIQFHASCGWIVWCDFRGVCMTSDVCLSFQCVTLFLEIMDLWWVKGQLHPLSVCFYTWYFSLLNVCRRGLLFITMCVFLCNCMLWRCVASLTL